MSDVFFTILEMASELGVATEVATLCREVCRSLRSSLALTTSVFWELPE